MDLLAAAVSPAASVLRNHWKLPPADSMQPNTHHLPGTAWHIVWTRPAGSSTGASLWAKTTPLVPRIALTRPAVTTPLPTAPAALSPAPPTTGVPAASPSSAAAAGVSRPVTSGDSDTGGSSDLSICSKPNNSSDHRRLATSSSSVPLASVTSVAYSPVSRRRT